MEIVVRDVRFRYGRKVALDGVDWTVRRGVTGLIGPNGAGKSTLLSLIVGLLRLPEGSLSVSGNDMSSEDGRRAARRHVGFVPQRFSLVPAMRVHDTVAYAAWVNGLAEKECGEAAEAALQETGLAELSRSRVRTLSGGQRQRIGIAAAIAHRPAVLVLDEPTVGLDPAQRLNVRTMFRSLGTTRSVLLSTHLIEDVVHSCDAVAVLAEGRVVHSGDVAGLQTLASAPQRSGSGSAFENAYLDLLERRHQT